MKRTHLPLLGIGFGLLVSATLSAGTAYTRKSINLRAGPSRDYPLVAEIPGGVPVDVNGCVDDFTWCDISIEDDRGWAYAGNLEYPYENRRVVILNNGPVFGLPIVTFSVGPYWDSYYRGRPWYSRRSYWSNRPAPPRWNGQLGSRPGYRPPGYRPPSVRPPRPAVVQPPGYRPQPLRPIGGRPEVVRPQPQPRPHGARPEVVRPQPQQQPRPQGARPEVARPKPQQAKPPDRSRRDDHKPGI